MNVTESQPCPKCCWLTISRTSDFIGLFFWCYAMYNKGMCGRQCLNATFSNRNAFWGNKIGARTRIWKQTWNYFTSISECFFFFLKEKGSKTILRAAATPRQLNENPSRAFCNLLNRNPVFLGRLSQPLFNPVPHYLCTLSPTVPLLEHSVFFAEVDGGNPWTKIKTKM